MMKYKILFIIWHGWLTRNFLKFSLWVKVFPKHGGSIQQDLTRNKGSLWLKDILYEYIYYKISAQRGARTHDRWIKSPTLYRLS